MERTSASARALLCPEILVEIFDYLTPGRPLDENALPRERIRRREAQQTLARAARVCHAFSGPALNVLWRVTDGLVSLLSVLPCFTFRIARHSKSYRDVSDAEWARLQQYAWRVRELYTAGDKQISPWVWTFLARRCPSGIGLIPRLQRLESLQVSPTEPGRIILLSPTLRHLVISAEPSPSHVVMDEAEHIANTVMDVVRKVCIPHLDSLRIVSLTHLPIAVETLVSPWTQLSHLQELEIACTYPVEADMLQTLATFPQLRKLTLSTAVYVDTSLIQPPNRPTPAFPALQELKLIGRARVTPLYLERIAPTSLTSLSLKFTEWPSALQDDAELTQLKTALTATATRALRRLEFTFAARHFPSDILEIVQPVLPLDGLTHIALRIEKLQEFFPLTETTLCAMATAWPNLVDFEISVAESDGDDHDLDVEDPPTAQSLILFAEQHPKLVRLVWPYVCMTVIRTLPELRAVPLLDHGLQVFRTSIVEKAPMPTYRAYAMLLDRLFPNLDLTDADIRYPAATKLTYFRERHGNWYDVEQLLLAIQEGRRGSHRLPVPSTNVLPVSMEYEDPEAFFPM
ncbi:hypothetical protein OH77DRAFT_1409962 [Trametes cingulata]|nr:hypothetical protein OH77DRAFT_1409962 [Trametes cingulata]